MRVHISHGYYKVLPECQPTFNGSVGKHGNGALLRNISCPSIGHIQDIDQRTKCFAFRDSLIAAPFVCLYTPVRSPKQIKLVHVLISLIAYKSTLAD